MGTIDNTPTIPHITRSSFVHSCLVHSWRRWLRPLPPGGRRGDNLHYLPYREQIGLRSNRKLEHVVNGPLLRKTSFSPTIRKNGPIRSSTSTRPERAMWLYSRANRTRYGGKWAISSCGTGGTTMCERNRVWRRIKRWISVALRRRVCS